MKQAKVVKILVRQAAWSGFAAALVFAAASCPREFEDAGAQGGGYRFAPLPSLLIDENFNGQTMGPLEIKAVNGDGSGGSPLDTPYGRFKVNLANNGEGSGLFITSEARGRALKISHTGPAGGNLITDLLFIPSEDAYASMQGKRVMLQYRVRLENTNNYYGIGPYIYHTRGAASGPAGWTYSGNTSVQSRIYGAGTFQWNSSIQNAWQTAPASQNEWHTVEFLLDFTACTYQCYLDGVRVVEEPFINRVSAGFGLIRFYIQSYSTALFLDDIRISTDADTSPFAPPSDPCPGSCGCNGLLDCGKNPCLCAPPGAILANEGFEDAVVFFPNDGNGSHVFSDGETIGTVIASENFSVAVPADASVTVTDEDGHRALKISAGSSGRAGITYNPESQTETDAKKITLSFKVKHDGKGTAAVPYVYYSGGSSNISVSAELSGGKLKYYYGSTYQTKQAEDNEWHRAGLIIDFDAETYTLILDGEEIIRAAAFRQTGSGFGKISFFIEGAAAPADRGTFWLDDIRISYEP